MGEAGQVTKYERALLSFLALILLAFALRTFRLDQQSFTWDEAKSVERALMPVPQMIDAVAGRRNQLPLYYLLLNPWLWVGTGQFVARYLSVLLGTMSIPLLFQVGRLTAGRPVGLLAAALLALSPFHIWYSQEARMYAFLVLALITAHWFLLRLLRNGAAGNWIGYGLAMTASVYTHYFALLIFLAHYIFFALHFRRMRRNFLLWLATTAAVAVAFVPWGTLVFFTERNGLGVPDWIGLVHWVDPLLSVLAFGAGSTIDPRSVAPYLVLAVYLPGLLLALGKWQLEGEGAGESWLAARLLLLWFLVPIGLTFLLSLDWPGLPRPPFSLYMDRYLIVTLPALVLLVAWGVQALARKKARPWLPPLALLLLVAGTLPGLANLYFDRLYARTDWRGAANQVRARSKEGDALLVGGDHVTPLGYYGQALPPQTRVPPGPLTVAELETFDEGMSRRLQEVVASGAQRVWLLSPAYNIDTHGFVQERNRLIASGEPVDTQQAWMDGHYDRIGSWPFTGIRVTLYVLAQEEQRAR